MRGAATVVALAGAVLLPVSLGLDWYELNTGDSLFELHGWDVFESVDAVMQLIDKPGILGFSPGLEISIEIDAYHRSGGSRAEPEATNDPAGRAHRSEEP